MLIRVSDFMVQIKLPAAQLASFAAVLGICEQEHKSRGAKRTMLTFELSDTGLLIRTVLSLTTRTSTIFVRGRYSDAFRPLVRLGREDIVVTELRTEADIEQHIQSLFDWGLGLGVDDEMIQRTLAWRAEHDVQDVYIWDK